MQQKTLSLQSTVATGTSDLLLSIKNAWLFQGQGLIAHPWEDAGRDRRSGHIKEVCLSNSWCSLIALVLSTDNLERLKEKSVCTTPRLPWGFPNL